MASIPIRNIWVLQLFASRIYGLKSYRVNDVETMPKAIPDIVARLLVREVELRLRTGLSVDFRRENRVVNRVRGRIDHLATARSRLLERGQVACRFDAVDGDTVGNRSVVAALRKAARLVCSSELEHRCRSLARQFEAMGIGDAAPALQELDRLIRDRRFRQDQRMLSAARLLLTLTIPTQVAGDWVHAHVELDDPALRKLYEEAVAGFYEVDLKPSGWRVRHHRWLTWDVIDPSEGFAALVPGMETDIELWSPPADGERHIVIDTKFTSVTRPGRGNRDRFKSDHIYQLLSYLYSQRDLTDTSIQPSEGMLLYPSVGEHIDESARLQGHRVRFYTVDLAAETQEMIRQLREAVQNRE